MIHKCANAARWLRLFCPGVLLAGWLVTGAPAATQYVIVISVDGLGGTYLGKLFDGSATGGPFAIPNFTRLKNEGAGTLVAHIDNDNWDTLPNHVSILTCRPRDGANGHNWKDNGTPTTTIRANKGAYVASVFDVAHDNGLMTGMYANKTKFSLFDTYESYTEGGSYNATNGALDAIPPDNGQDKVDNPYINFNLGGIVVNTFIDQQKSVSPNRYAFVHINEPDASGHSSGWGSAGWNTSVVAVDGMLGKIFKLIEQDVPAMTGNTAIILTADHGNQDNPPTAADRYAVPFYVWGPGVPAGADLYLLNPDTRKEASSYPMMTYGGIQPIRNAEANNLALKMLGLGPIPGSTFNFTQNLVATITDSPAHPFAAWIHTKYPSLTSPQDRVDADPDGDGLANGIEYVLGSRPDASNTGGPTGATDGDDFVFSFRRALDSKDADTLVAIQVGSDLVTWPPAAVYVVGTDTGASTAGVTVGTPTGGYETVSLRVPRSATGMFARLRVTVTAP